MKKKLPKFSRQGGIPQNAGKSKEEEMRFWDTHSLLDYPGEFTPLDSKHLTGFTEGKEPFKFAPDFIRLRAENHGCKPVDECRKVHYGEMSPQHVGGGPRRPSVLPRGRPLALPRGRREAAAGFSGTTAVKPWGSIKKDRYAAWRRGI